MAKNACTIIQRDLKEDKRKMEFHMKEARNALNDNDTQGAISSLHEAIGWEGSVKRLKWLINDLSCER